jgi:hypothetical protein
MAQLKTQEEVFARWWDNPGAAATRGPVSFDNYVAYSEGTPVVRLLVEQKLALLRHPRTHGRMVRHRDSFLSKTPGTYTRLWTGDVMLPIGHPAHVAYSADMSMYYLYKAQSALRGFKRYLGYADFFLQQIRKLGRTVPVFADDKEYLEWLLAQGATRSEQPDPAKLLMARARNALGD